MRIKGHIDYGNGAGPKAAPLHTAPLPVVKRPPIVRPAPIRVRQVARSIEDVYQFVRGYAERGERAPTRELINKKLGYMGNGQILDLARAGRITIEVYGKNWRVIRVGNLHTMLPETGQRPYRVIDTGGDNWFTGGHWHRYGR